MSILKDFFKILITSNNKNLDNISKKIEVTSQKTAELKSLQDGIYNLQKQLVANQNKLSSIINTVTDAIIVIDLNGEVVLWNRAAERMFQYTIDEIHQLGLGVIMDIVDKNSHTQRIAQLKSEFKYNKNININNKLIYKTARRKDNTTLPVEISVSSWRNNGDLYFTAIVRDLTERAETLKELYTSQTINELIISNAADGIMVYDKNLNYLVWNPAMETITKYKAEEVIGKNVFDVFPGLKDSEFTHIFPTVLSGSEARASLSYYTDKEGEHKYLKGRYSPLYDVNKENIIGIVGIIRIFPKEEVRTPDAVQQMDATGKTTKP